MKCVCLSVWAVWDWLSLGGSHWVCDSCWCCVHRRSAADCICICWLLAADLAKTYRRRWWVASEPSTYFGCKSLESGYWPFSSLKNALRMIYVFGFCMWVSISALTLLEGHLACEKLLQEFLKILLWNPTGTCNCNCKYSICSAPPLLDRWSSYSFNNIVADRRSSYT